MKLTTTLWGKLSIIFMLIVCLNCLIALICGVPSILFSTSDSASFYSSFTTNVHSITV